MIKMTNEETGETRTFNCLSAAALSLGISKGNLSQCINGKRKSVNGWSAAAADEGEAEPVVCPAEIEELPESIASLITRDSKNKPEKTIENIVTWLENTDKYKDKFRLNMFTGRWSFNNQDWTSDYLGTIRKDAEKALKFDSESKLKAAISDIMNRNRFNPVIDMIDALPDWDGTPRMEEFFIKYLGADDTHLNRTLTKKWMFGMMKRLFEPGCDWDYMLIIHDSVQGTGKTKLISRLAKGLVVDKIDITNKDCINVMNRKWVVNFDELKDLLSDKKDMNAVKTFISQTEDSNRLAFGQDAADYKRHVVFYGTTNEDYFLRDYTDYYERRFWVMECHGTRRSPSWWKNHLPESIIDQVLAEIYAYYVKNPNEDGVLPPEDETALAAIQDRHKTSSGDSRYSLIVKKIIDSRYTAEELTDAITFQKRITAMLGKYTTYSSEDPTLRIYRIDQEWVRSIFTDRPLKYMSKLFARYGWREDEASNGKFFVAPNEEELKRLNGIGSKDIEIDDLFNGK